MRILFATYSLAFLNPGGGERVVLSLKDALMRRGHSVDLYDAWQSRFEDYDVIHYFSCVEPTRWKWMKQARPLVVTPTANFTGNVARSRHEHFRYPDLWLAATEREAEGLQARWGIVAPKIQILPNGVGPQFFGADPAPFRERFGIEVPFVLHVGRFDPVKNQDRLIRACQGIPLVMIGGANPEQLEYFERCQALARETGARILEPMRNDDPLLASAYAACEVFALPSDFETFGIAALEAAAAGAPLALTQAMAARELFVPFAEFFDPRQESAIRQGIERARKLPRDVPARAGLRARMSWDALAAQLERIYLGLSGLPRAGSARAGLPTTTA